MRRQTITNAVTAFATAIAAFLADLAERLSDDDREVELRRVRVQYCRDR